MSIVSIMRRDLATKAWRMRDMESFRDWCIAGVVSALVIGMALAVGQTMLELLG